MHAHGRSRVDGVIEKVARLWERKRCAGEEKIEKMSREMRKWATEMATENGQEGQERPYTHWQPDNGWTGSTGDGKPGRPAEQVKEQSRRDEAERAQDEELSGRMVDETRRDYGTEDALRERANQVRGIE